MLVLVLVGILCYPNVWLTLDANPLSSVLSAPPLAYQALYMHRFESVVAPSMRSRVFFVLIYACWIFMLGMNVSVCRLLLYFVSQPGNLWDVRVGEYRPQLFLFPRSMSPISVLLAPILHLLLLTILAPCCH